MNKQNFLSPREIAYVIIKTGIKKTNIPIINMILLGILAGVYIAFASEGSSMAAFNLLAKPETYGLGRILAGAIFTTGLMLVVIAGGELFTGNTMIVAGVFEGKVRIAGMLKNWLFVYVGNLMGSVFIAYLMNQSGLFSSGADLLGGITIKIAVNKVGFTFIQAFVLGILCNWLVCLAIWMAYAAQDITGKIFAVYFPIWLFVTSGFEHCVANMYYIPAGIMAKGNTSFVDAAISLGVTPEKLSHLNWETFFINNLFPVTLGNTVSGVFFVATIYWFVYIKNEKAEE